MNSIAYAMGAGGTGAAGAQAGNPLTGFLPIILIFVIFYFLLIRPQQKKSKAHNAMLTQLKKGDKVLSAGGIFGEITGIKEDVVTLEIAPKVRVKVSRSSVSAKIQN